MRVARGHPHSQAGTPALRPTLLIAPFIRSGRVSIPPPSPRPIRSPHAGEVGRGIQKSATIRWKPLSPALSPLVPRRERGHFCDGGCIKMRSIRSGRTTEFFRDAKAPVIRFFVAFVAFCRVFRTAGGRIPTKANKGNEDLGQDQEGERGSPRQRLIPIFTKHRGSAQELLSLFCLCKLM